MLVIWRTSSEIKRKKAHRNKMEVNKMFQYEQAGRKFTIKINCSRWTKDLNISNDTIKVLDENIRRKISDTPHSNIFTNMSLTARDLRKE